MTARNTSAPGRLLVEVYRSPRHDLMYVYLPARAELEQPNADLSVLPEVLLERFGTPVYSLSFELHEERTLAAADATTVLAALESQGFYLQMPPSLQVQETPDARNPHEAG